MDKTLLQIASNVLGVAESRVGENCKEVPECDAFYFWNPVRGGLSVLIGKNGEKLAAVSGVGSDQLIKDYKAGIRN